MEAFRRSFRTKGIVLNRNNRIWLYIWPGKTATTITNKLEEVRCVIRNSLAFALVPYIRWTSTKREASICPVNYSSTVFHLNLEACRGLRIVFKRNEESLNDVVWKQQWCWRMAWFHNPSPGCTYSYDKCRSFSRKKESWLMAITWVRCWVQYCCDR